MAKPKNNTEHPRTPNRICRYCDTAFYARPNKIALGMGLYCSQRCYREYEYEHFPEKFWSLVEKTDTCWLWRGRIDPHGYGMIMFKRKGTRAHRMAYQLSVGPIPQGLFVCHTCDNPPCVNPEHLVAATHDFNMADKCSKGRQCRGVSHGMSKVTEDKVREMRHRYSIGGVTLKELSAIYGFHFSTIALIIQRKTWAHVA